MKIYNAHIVPMVGKEIQCGYVEFENGKITAVGEMADCEVSSDDCDAKGAALYPGFIDAHSHLGMWEDSLDFEGDDGNEDTDPTTPQLRAIDAVNPCDFCFEETAAAGITTVVTGPGSANPIGGQLAAIKTVGLRIDDMIIDPFVAMKCALGENPKNTYHGKDRSPVTRMATASIIREQLMKAKHYADDLDRAKNDEDYEEPEYDIKCEALLPVIRGEKPVHFHAHRVDDIFSAIRIAKEFSLKYVIVHATQGYKIAEHLAAEDAKVLCGPVISERCKPELAGLTPANAGVLSKAGVKTAIVSDHPVIPAQYLAICAGLCVREGMDRDEALRALTIYPAEILGLQDRVGSISVGKDADFVLFESDPLTIEAKPKRVWVNGKVVL